MTARCIGFVDESGRMTHAMVVDAPVPKTHWLGRLVGRLNPKYILGFTLLALACFAFYKCFSKPKKDQRAPSAATPVASSVSTLTFSADSAKTIVSFAAGTWIGSDKENEFGKHLTQMDGTPIRPAPDDFYLVFQLHDQHDYLYLPSPLFVGKKEGDLVEYKWDGQLRKLHLQNTAFQQKPFHEVFSELQQKAKESKPGSGKLTYQFFRNRPENSLNIGAYTLSSNAKKAVGRRTNQALIQMMVAPTQGDCELLAKATSLCLEKQFNEVSRKDGEIVLRHEELNAEFSLTLIVDIHTIYLAAEVRKWDRTNSVNTLWNLIPFVEEIDPMSVQVTDNQNTLTISYKLIAPQTV